MTRALHATTLAAALGCGLMGGVFFAFSSFVMPALARLPSAQGISAMQAINVKAESTLFLPVFMATTLACGGLGVVAVANWSEPWSRWLLAGSASFTAGAFLLTVGYHVPHNNALASLHPHAAEAAQRWHRYVAGWSALNHVRAATSLGAAALLTMALKVA